MDDINKNQDEDIKSQDLSEASEPENNSIPFVDESFSPEDTAAPDKQADGTAQNGNVDTDASKKETDWQPLLYAIGGAVIMLAFTGLIALCNTTISSSEDVARNISTVETVADEETDETFELIDETEAETKAEDENDAGIGTEDTVQVEAADDSIDEIQEAASSVNIFVFPGSGYQEYGNVQASPDYGPQNNGQAQGNYQQPSFNQHSANSYRMPNGFGPNQYR